MNAIVEWDPNPEPDLSHYRVYYGVTPAFGSVENTANTSITLTGLPDGRDIYIGISSVNNSLEESAVSDPVTIINRYVYVSM